MSAAILREWLNKQRGLPDLSVATAASGEAIYCPECGKEIGAFVGRHSGKVILRHWLAYSNCNIAGRSWYGGTRAEAEMAFNRFFTPPTAQDSGTAAGEVVSEQAA